MRLLLGIVTAGMWPGMTYYLTLFYPPSRIGKRIGQYFTASQVSAAVVGLVSAGFQEMDGAKGLVGFQWMFLVYGVITVALGFVLLWWLPDRPTPPGEERPKRNALMRWVPDSKPALQGQDAVVHYHDMKRVYHSRPWTMRDLLAVFLDWRLWPLLVMYFGVVGVGIGVQLYANLIIQAINPNLSGVDLSLLTAPIWIVCFDLCCRVKHKLTCSRWILSPSYSSLQCLIASIATARCFSPSRFFFRFWASC